MIHIYVFNICLVLACAYAFWRGGGPERSTAAIFLIAATATFWRPDALRDDVQAVLLAIDIVTLLSLVAIALTANRYWPLYVAALQLLTIAIHGVKAYDDQLPQWMYISANGKLAYPTLILLAIGAMRHHHRILRHGSDRGWSIVRR